MYEIHSKSDFQMGATLVVKIPKEEIDQKALNTILADQPDFILPFRHRVIDEEIEFTYQIGKRHKLVYLSGSRSASEYVDLWFSVLQPLLDCGDWFMNPYSFVLKPEYIFCDKKGKTISFVYIPSLLAYSNHTMLKSMVTDIAKQNQISDINLENKVVWAIQDFNPKDFLQVVKPFKSQIPMAAAPKNVSTPKPEQLQQPLPKPTLVKPQPQSVHKAEPLKNNPPKADDIAICFPSAEKAGKEEKAKSGLFGSKKEKKVKSKEKPKNADAFWGKKKAIHQEIIQGAAAVPKQEDAVIEPVFPVCLSPMALEIDDVTQFDFTESAAKFRYIGSSEHPKVIEVGVEEGEIFTIGRFDINIGAKQSSFEFDKKTKAISRRHAAVERSVVGYNLVDLASAAGTFLNGQKLPPNAPFKLECGSRVSFGNLGAEYIWEE